MRDSRKGLNFLLPELDAGVRMAALFARSFVAEILQQVTEVKLRMRRRAAIRDRMTQHFARHVLPGSKTIQRRFTSGSNGSGNPGIVRAFSA